MTSMKFDNDWWRRAKCGSCNPYVFEIPNKKAYEICEGCPVRDMCLEHVLESPWLPFGIWGGQPQNKIRKQWRKRHPRASRLEVEALMGLVS